MSLSEDAGSSVVTMDGLKEQESADIEVHIIRSWLEDLATIPDGNELHTAYSPKAQHLWAQWQSSGDEKGAAVSTLHMT